MLHPTPLCFPFLNMPTLRQDTSNFARTRRFPKERKRARPFLRFPSILLAISAFTGMRLVMHLCGRMRIRLANFDVLRSRIGPSFVSERFGQGLRWTFQHQLSCTYCASRLDQSPIQVHKRSTPLWVDLVQGTFGYPNRCFVNRCH